MKWNIVHLFSIVFSSIGGNTLISTKRDGIFTEMFWHFTIFYYETILWQESAPDQVGKSTSWTSLKSSNLFSINIKNSRRPYNFAARGTLIYLTEDNQIKWGTDMCNLQNITHLQTLANILVWVKSNFLTIDVLLARLGVHLKSCYLVKIYPIFIEWSGEINRQSSEKLRVFVNP